MLGLQLLLLEADVVGRRALLHLEAAPKVAKQWISSRTSTSMHYRRRIERLLWHDFGRRLVATHVDHPELVGEATGCRRCRRRHRCCCRRVRRGVEESEAGLCLLLLELLGPAEWRLSPLQHVDGRTMRLLMLLLLQLVVVVVVSCVLLFAPIGGGSDEARHRGRRRPSAASATTPLAFVAAGAAVVVVVVVVVAVAVEVAHVAQLVLGAADDHGVGLGRDKIVISISISVIDIIIIVVEQHGRLARRRHIVRLQRAPIGCQAKISPAAAVRR